MEDRMDNMVGKTTDMVEEVVEREGDNSHTPLHLVLSRSSTGLLKQKAQAEMVTAAPVVVMPPKKKLKSKKTESKKEKIASTSMKKAYKEIVRGSGASNPKAKAPTNTNVPTADLLKAIWAAQTTTRTTSTTTTITTTTTTTTTSTITPSSSSLAKHFQSLDSSSHHQASPVPQMPNPRISPSPPLHLPLSHSPQQRYHDFSLPGETGGDQVPEPTSSNQVLLVGPSNLPDTLHSLERLLGGAGDQEVTPVPKPSKSAIPSKEEIMNMFDSVKQPKSINKVLSRLDKDSNREKKSFRSPKKKVAALKERAKQANITYNKVHDGAPKPTSAPRFRTVLNPVTGAPLGVVSNMDGSFHPVGASARPVFHPREHNTPGPLTDEFQKLLQDGFAAGLGEAW